MIKAPRFIKEYARDKQARLNDLAMSGHIDMTIYQDKFDMISRIVNYYEQGIVTIDETMLEIAKV